MCLLIQLHFRAGCPGAHDVVALKHCFRVRPEALPELRCGRECADDTAYCCVDEDQPLSGEDSSYAAS
jgi:hypothetical protein